MSKISRISPVLAVENVQAAIAWYGQAFGFTTTYVSRHSEDEAGDSWNYALLATNNREIHLCKRLANDETVSSPSNCYFYVEDIHALHTHLTEMGADVTDLQEMPWGSIECWLHDPDGNRVVLSCQL